MVMPKWYGWNYVYQKKSKPIYVYSFYQSPGSSLEPLFEFNDILTTIHESSVSPVLLAGNFNLPDLKFEDGIGYVNPNPTYGYVTNSLFVEMMNDYGFEQLVTQPTRENHWFCQQTQILLKMSK